MYHSSDITCDCDGAFCWFVLLILFLIYFSFFFHKAPTEPAITIVGSDYPEATDFAGFAFYGYSGTLMVRLVEPSVFNQHIATFMSWRTSVVD